MFNNCNVMNHKALYLFWLLQFWPIDISVIRTSLDGFTKYTTHKCFDPYEIVSPYMAQQFILQSFLQQ